MAAFSGVRGDLNGRLNQDLTAPDPNDEHAHPFQIRFPSPVSGVFHCTAAVFDFPTSFTGDPNNSAYFSIYISEVNGTTYHEHSPGMGSTVALKGVTSISATVKYKNCSVIGTLMGPL